MPTPYFFSMINPGTIVMGALFLIFLALLSYILSKVFRDKYGNVNTMTVGVISFCISVLIVYFGRDTIYNTIDGLRLSNTILYVLSGVVILIILLTFRKKLRFYIILMLIGAGLVLIGALTDFFYQKGFVFVIGAILFLLGIWAWKRRNKRDKIKEMDYWERRDYREGRKKQLKRWEKAGEGIGYKMSQGTVYAGKKMGQGAAYVGRKIRRRAQERKTMERRNVKEKEAMERIAKAGRRAQERKTMDRRPKKGKSNIVDRYGKPY